jgi:hypothetical protein
MKHCRQLQLTDLKEIALIKQGFSPNDRDVAKAIFLVVQFSFSSIN